jgi:hypothetical protein
LKLTIRTPINPSQSKHSLLAKVPASILFSHSNIYFNHSCEKNTYEGDVMKRKNSAVSIGNGKRSDFTKSLTASPGVSKYNLKTLFD